MAFDSVPWFIGGGAIHSPEVARNLAHDALGGAEGIMEVADLKVSELTIPGAAVKVALGGCALKNGYAGGYGQMYTGRNDADVTVAVGTTGAGAGRSDMVIVRIDDPQYGGVIPVDRTVGPYIRAQVISNVSPTATKASQLGLTYPAIALARIDIPINTAAITNAMVRDMRQVARPRRYRTLSSHAIVIGQEEYLSSTVGEIWPNAPMFTVDIPEWATRMKVVATWQGVRAAAGSNAFGQLWVRLGYGTVILNTQVVNFDSMAATNVTRSTMGCTDDVYIPPSARGTTQALSPMGKLGAAVTTGNRPQMDSVTSVYIDCEFTEVAD